MQAHMAAHILSLPEEVMRIIIGHAIKPKVAVPSGQPTAAGTRETNLSALLCTCKVIFSPET